MEDENRPDGHPDDEDADAGWYFDLPTGAWERQEAKNRELRQNVRRNIDDAEPKKDVFGAPIRDGFDLGDEPEYPGEPVEAAEDAPDDASGAWAGAPESAEPAPGAGWLTLQNERSEYSTEPPVDSPNAFKLRSRRLHEDDEPKLKPPPGLFGFQPDDEATDSRDDAEAAPERARRIAPREERPAPPPEPVERGEAVPGAQAERKSSRWDDLFGEKASEGASMLDGMRNWAKSASHEPEPEHPRLRDVDEFPPSSADDKMPPASVTPERLRVQRHDADEPPLVNTENPQTRWDQMFGGKPADDAGLLEGMRSWAQKHDDEPAAPHIRLAPEADDGPEQLFEPFGWEAEQTPPVEQVVGASLEEPDPAEKKGLLGKLFGKKRKRDTALDGPVAEAHNRFTEDETPAGDGSRGAWLGRGDGGENRFSPAPSDREWVPAEEASQAARASGWALADDDGGAPRFPRVETFADENASALDTRSDFAEDVDVEEDPLAAASWSPAPSVEDEERFSELSSWFANRNAQAVTGEPAGATDELDTEPPQATVRDEAMTPQAVSAEAEPAMGADQDDLWGAVASAPASEQPAFADAGDDGWDPEPADELPAAPVAAWTAASANEDSPREMTEWVAEVDTAPQPVDSLVAAEPDDDPWTPLDALESDDDDVASVAEIPGSNDPFAATVPAADESDDEAMPEAAGGFVARDPEAGLVTRPDDPWAMFVRGRVAADVEVPADDREPEEITASPATTSALEPLDTPEAATDWDDVTGMLEPDSAAEEEAEGQAPAGAPWDSDFARAHGTSVAEEHDDAASEAADDDPWSVITRATGYEESSDAPAVRATAPVEPPYDRYEPDLEYEDSYANAPGELAPSDSFGAELPAVSLPAWDDTQVDDDTVLRAFEAHASARARDEVSPYPQSPPETDSLVFDDLLGADAEDIVAEASEASPEQRYFGRMQGWAPQRAPGERQPYPWEQDAQEPSRQPDAREEAGADAWDGDEEIAPPWSTEPVAAGSAHTDAPSVRRRSRSRVLVREIVETGLLALLVFLSVRASFQNFKVDGYSMWPTLDDGEYLIVNKLAYSEVDMDRLSNFVPFVDPGDDPKRELFGGPERGDIVVLKDPRENDTDLIKRIVGLPGETLEIVDGKVYINDMLLIEPYIKEEWHDDKEKIAIPEGFYFVMGDNRNNSMDSRSAQIALIPKDLIIGKAMLTYWPRNKFGLAPNDSGDISEKDGRPVVTAERVEE